MKLLIDTNVLIWLINGHKSLGSKTLKLLQDTNNEVYLSYFSLFEMKIKSAAGKSEYNDTIVEDLPKMGVELVMPDLEVLSKYKIYDQSNKDPFDNMLIAVAIDHKMTMVTSDTKILELKHDQFTPINSRE